MVSNRLKVLAVDDDDNVLDMISIKLGRAGFIVQKAENGRAALEMVRADRPHLVILDIMMPDMSGLDVCKILKRQVATEDIPVIMLTAKGGEIDRVVGLELGADDYIAKPFSPQELLLRVKSVLGIGPKGLKPRASRLAE